MSELTEAAKEAFEINRAASAAFLELTDIERLAACVTVPADGLRVCCFVTGQVYFTEGQKFKDQKEMRDYLQSVFERRYSDEFMQAVADCLLMMLKGDSEQGVDAFADLSDAELYQHIFSHSNSPVTFLIVCQLLQRKLELKKVDFKEMGKMAEEIIEPKADQLTEAMDGVFSRENVLQ